MLSQNSGPTEFLLDRSGRVRSDARLMEVTILIISYWASCSAERCWPGLMPGQPIYVRYQSGHLSGIETLAGSKKKTQFHRLVVPKWTNAKGRKRDIGCHEFQQRQGFPSPGSSDYFQRCEKDDFERQAAITLGIHNNCFGGCIHPFIAKLANQSQRFSST